MSAGRRLRVVVGTSAALDIETIATRIRVEQPAAADRFLFATRRLIDDLGEFPRLGRRLRFRTAERRVAQVPGFRNYLVLYEVGARRVRVSRVVHAAQDARGV